MGLMHDSDEYGVLRWSLKEISQAIGCTVALVKELAAKEVLKGCDSGKSQALIYIPRSGRKDGDPVTLITERQGPIWYSSRMVKDEYIRTIRGESSRFGNDQEQTPKAAPKPAIGATPKAAPSRRQSDGSSSSSSSSVVLSNSGGKSLSFPVKARGGEGFTPGNACQAMREAGIPETNPSHPTLVALVEAGASAEEFAVAAKEAHDRGKGFSYALTIVKNRREEAAQLVLHQGRMPNKQEALEASNHAVGDEWERKMLERMANEEASNAGE